MWFVYSNLWGSYNLEEYDNEDEARKDFEEDKERKVEGVVLIEGEIMGRFGDV